MDKAPFFAGVQQELYFLPFALGALAARRDERSANEVLADRIDEEGLGVEHLEGLGLYETDAEDDDGYPAIPDRTMIRPKLAEDCLDQLRQLGLVDGEDRVTPAGRECMRNREALQRALSGNYRVEGEDERRRRVGRWFRRVCGWIRDAGEEREDDIRSVRYRPALCLAEFMQLHFWLLKAHTRRDGRPSASAFADDIVENRRTVLEGLDVGEGGIEYAAIVMADAAVVLLEKDWPEAAEKIAAARSSAIMLCDADVLYPVGMPGGLQWLYPVREWRPGGKPPPPKKKKRRKAAR
ncbi:MAG: hypothetical protein OXE57_19150 [Alphaproteobacteria bacterium]|nr:hypothetical protein [Alphaproteobacteria bacterium]